MALSSFACKESSRRRRTMLGLGGSRVQRSLGPQVRAFCVDPLAKGNWTELVALS